MLSGCSLYCERNDRVLFRQLCFQLQEGQVLQVKGNNGTGKTTLLRILSGIHDSFEGQINWYGKPVSQTREILYDSLLYLGHRIGINQALSPLENLAWNCALHQPASRQKIREALQALGLSGYEESQCCRLSAGQQQRVSLARLLLRDARLWVLDEPFSTLDADGISLLERLIAAQTKKAGAVIVTSHHHLSIADLQVLQLGNDGDLSA